MARCAPQQAQWSGVVPSAAVTSGDTNVPPPPGDTRVPSPPPTTETAAAASTGRGVSKRRRHTCGCAVPGGGGKGTIIVYSPWPGGARRICRPSWLLGGRPWQTALRSLLSLQRMDRRNAPKRFCGSSCEEKGRHVPKTHPLGTQLGGGGALAAVVFLAAEGRDVASAFNEFGRCSTTEQHLYHPTDDELLLSSESAVQASKRQKNNPM